MPLDHPSCRLALLLALLLAPAAGAATLHVWQDSPDPQPPFDSWKTAARVLQDAADAARTGDTVLVTNGVYRAGGRVVRGEVTNRIAIPPGVVVQSVEGPSVTIIEGAPRTPPPGGGTVPAPSAKPDPGNGDGAVRCAFLGRDAMLVGFTLRDGHTRTNGMYDWDQSGGGAFCDTQAKLVKCILTNNAAHHMGGGSFRADLDQCRAVDNQARYGGAACLAALTDSEVSGNSAENGGGAYLARLVRCNVVGNDANIGGGSMGGSMLSCLVRSNVAGQWGGGVSQTSLQLCRVEDNKAERGGGTFGANVFGSVITRNSADLGGGAAGGTLRHCTVTGNTAGSGGGTYLVSVHHSIVYFNDAIFGPNHDGSTFLASCTTPLPESGSGNLADDPRLASVSHLAADSPCLAVDSQPPELPTDADGDPWQSPSSMGADQIPAGQVTGRLEVRIATGSATLSAGYHALWMADIEGPTTHSEWDFGDGRVVRDQPWIRHGWDVPGTYEVTLTAFNDAFPEGLKTSLRVDVVPQPVFYVAPSSPRPVPPFSSWDSAAPSIQSAIEAATVPGSLILVTNGTYNRSGTPLPGDVVGNRVALTKPVVVRSVNGPTVTRIVGAGPLSDFAVRCAFVGRDAVLSGFTLTNGYTRTLGAPPREQRGGGVSGEALGVVTNCIITGNLARQYGAGAYRIHLRNCRIAGNQSLDGGGGVYECRVDDCTLEANRASNSGGGASRSTLQASLLLRNAAPLGAGAYFGTLESCRLEANVFDGDGYGGGANGSLLTDCDLIRNTAYSGGGAYAASLVRCRLEANEARRDGGGATASTLVDCVVSTNLATHGGGASISTLTTCRLLGNRATVAGGGADGGTLDRCTLAENTAFYGGASENATLRRCVVRDNTATFGGASYQDLLFNCLLTGNVADQEGGAAFRSQLFQVTAVGNSAARAGGTSSGTNRNSIVYFNTAIAGPDFLESTMIASCTAPTLGLPDDTVTRPPAFRAPESGDFRLRGDSPCIDAGTDLASWLADDHLGLPRPIDGDLDGLARFDIGAHEYDPDSTDTDGDGIPDAWLLRHGLDPADPAVGRTDTDGDGLTNRDEWIVDSDPTDASSALSVSVTNQPPVTLRVPSIAGRVYTLLSRDRLGPESGEPSPWAPVPGQLDIPGTGQALVLQDTNVASANYYRVEVRWPESNRPGLHATAGRVLFRTPVRIAVATSPTPPVPATDLGRPDPEATMLAASRPLGLFERTPAADTADPARTDTPDLAKRTEPSGRNRGSLQATPKPTGPHRFRIAPGSEIAISPRLRGQEPFMLYARSARLPTLRWGRGATFRGVAGGTDAETYDWKRLTASTRPHFWSHHVDDPPVVTTLEWLEEARDYDAELILTVNTRGRGNTVPTAQGQFRWTVDPASNRSEYLAQLAADWVRYVNLVAPKYRLTPDRQLPPDLATTDPEAHRVLTELAALGNGTNAWAYRLATVANPDLEVDPWLERPLLLPSDAPADVRKVTYWEIGNEVETPMNVSDPRGARPMDSSVNLSPAQFVERYLRITDAMRRVDPTIRVGPCPNNPWGPRAGIENEHLIQLLAHPEAKVDVLYYHYYNIWSGDYFRPSDVNRNLRTLKNFAYLLDSQYAAQFARAGRARVPSIISEWNPDWSIHPPIERTLVSALATAEVFLTFAELQIFAAHYWENPDGRASGLVFDKLQTHLGDRFLGSSYGEPADDGTYVGFGGHPSIATDVRVYATQRSADGRVFVWLVNLSETTSHSVVWEHPFPVVEARTHALRNRAGPNTYYAPVAQLEWVTDPARVDLPETALPPASLLVVEITYDRHPLRPEPPIISSLRRTRGGKDTELVITGDGFSEDPTRNTVHFGNGRAQVLTGSSSFLRVLVPGTATYGPVTVTVDGRTAYSQEFFALSANPEQDNPVTPDSLVPVAWRVFPPEGAPIVTAPVDILLGDWQGDGRLDMAGLTTRAGSVLPHTIDLYENVSTRGEPAFATPFCDPQLPQCSLPLNASPAKVAVGDLDGDGLLDLACVDRHAWHVATWRNAHPSPDRSFDMVGTFSTARIPSFVAIQDLDQDGRPDLVVTHAGDHSLGVLRNISPGPGFLLFATNQIFRASGPNQMVGPHAVAVGDFVGDGRPDVVVASRGSAGLTLFRNESTAGRLELVPLPEITGARIESMTLGDVDGDGLLDIVASGQWPDGGVMIWRRTRTDTFERHDVATSRDPRQVRVADINGDGLPEVLTVNNDTATVSVLRNRSSPGTVAFDARQDYAIPGILPNDPICLAVGDVDDDGRSDVVVGHYYSGFLTLLRNASAPGAAPPPPGDPDESDESGARLDDVPHPGRGSPITTATSIIDATGTTPSPADPHGTSPTVAPSPR